MLTSPAPIASVTFGLANSATSMSTFAFYCLFECLSPLFLSDIICLLLKLGLLRCLIGGNFALGVDANLLSLHCLSHSVRFLLDDLGHISLLEYVNGQASHLQMMIQRELCLVLVNQFRVSDAELRM